MHPWNATLFETLTRRAGRFPHALLIHGPQGTGKLSLAEHLALWLLCESAVHRPCGACEGCRWLAAGNHPDFRRVEPEALALARGGDPEGEEGEGPARRGKPSLEIRIEQVRQLTDFLNLRSHRGGPRIALLHPGEAMNGNAANALLKGLEEPPLGALFVLVCHHPSRLLPTIRSRCVALPVPLPAQDVALRWLHDQGVKDPERWLAYAGGAPLRALDYAARGAALERLLAAPGPVDTREDLEELAEALQKRAFDQALMAFGLPAKYRTGVAEGSPQAARAWLSYARQMGRHRLLSRHPLNAKLFSLEMLAGQPR